MASENKYDDAHGASHSYILIASARDLAIICERLPHFEGYCSRTSFPVSKAVPYKLRKLPGPSLSFENLGFAQAACGRLGTMPESLSRVAIHCSEDTRGMGFGAPNALRFDCVVEVNRAISNGLLLLLELQLYYHLHWRLLPVTRVIIRLFLECQGQLIIRGSVRIKAILTRAGRDGIDPVISSPKTFANGLALMFDAR
ncbi:hypothetical protein EAF04_003092 [Stromatinia cepivora]|nr:hypothetical protein EAF04_003092 [Stromatinia cepivora]